MLQKKSSSKRILWFSRHRPIASQCEELKRIFGSDVHIIIETRPFTGADEIVAKFKRIKADEIVLVAPLSVCRQVLAKGLKPLWAEMEPTTMIDAEISTDGKADRLKGVKRHYRFVRFRRLAGIELKLEEL